MYTLLHHGRLREGWLVETPSLVLSVYVAEMFYKFHSFTLECGAFLATWFMVSYLFSLIRGVWSAKQDGQA
jgi:hypothetical protein